MMSSSFGDGCGEGVKVSSSTLHVNYKEENQLFLCENPKVEIWERVYTPMENLRP